MVMPPLLCCCGLGNSALSIKASRVLSYRFTVPAEDRQQTDLRVSSSFSSGSAALRGRYGITRVGKRGRRTLLSDCGVAPLKLHLRRGSNALFARFHPWAGVGPLGLDDLPLLWPGTGRRHRPAVSYGALLVPSQLECTHRPGSA